MVYQFVCTKCKHKQSIEMKMVDYTAEGHICEKCGSPLEREISNMVAMSIDKTGTFYRKLN